MTRLDKSTIMARGPELKGSNYSITDQFPLEIMKRRRLLYPIMGIMKYYLNIERSVSADSNKERQFEAVWKRIYDAL